MAQASAPTRGDKITVGFGIINVPVQLFNGVDEAATKITRNQFGPSGEKVKYDKVDSGTGEVLTADQIVLKYTTSDGTKVDLSDEEVAAAMGVENGQSELLGVFPLTDLAQYPQSGPAYVRPQSLKVGTKTTRPFDEAYSLFFGALTDSESFALVRFVTRGKPKVIAMYGEGEAVFLHWDNEVRVAPPQPVVELTDEKRALALVLLKTMMGADAPVLENEAVDAVRTYAEAKAGGQPVEVKSPAVQAAATDDLLALMEASIAAAKVTV